MEGMKSVLLTKQGSYTYELIMVVTSHTDLAIPNSNMEKGVGCEIQPLNEELLATVSC